MKKENIMGINAKKEEDFSEWYNQVVIKADLADYSAVKGCMIIKNNGYSIWENIQSYFNKRLEKLYVKNVYFPLFIPESFFKKEEAHAVGFKPEVAWLEGREDGERLAIRPTSETIMYDTFKKWIRSYRDLPLRINQWANIVRIETKMTKLFLRTREFLWQEGHCVYENEQDCNKETRLYLEEYRKLCEELLAIPVLAGKKSEKEKFAGANYTLSIETFMPDGRILQLGTSHNLGQGFAKVFGIKFLGKDEKMHLPWQNSWGFSTRLIGALVMMHSDNKGLVLPPKVAKNKVVIVPIIFEKDKKKILQECERLKKNLEKYNPILDERDEYTPGWKFNEWELKGVPIRIEIGPKDIKKKQVVVVRRDNHKKTAVKISRLVKFLDNVLEDMQKDLFNKAKKFLSSSIVNIKNLKEFESAIKNKKLVRIFHCGLEKCEEDISNKFSVKSANIPFDAKKGRCFNCGKEGYETYFAKSY